MVKKQIVGLIVTGLITATLIFSLSTYLALLDPATGPMWTSLLTAEHPKRLEVVLPGLSNEVLVYRDSWGVPHIYAKSEADLFYAFGYVQAQDRLWQMDFMRRLCEGKLSEVVGEPVYEMDVFYRIIGLHRAAEETWNYLKQNDPELADLVQAFTDGVNAYIEQNMDNLPLEFKLLGYKPEPWTPVDSLTIGKFIGWGLTGTFWDLERKILVDALGSEAVDELFPLYEYEMFTIIPENYTEYLKDPLPIKSQIGTKFESNKDIQQAMFIDGILKILRWKEEVDKWSGFFESIGSNNWVVDGNLTTTGKPILCNDPHLELTVPPVWYEAHLIVENGFNVRGVTFPGIPVIVIGHNAYLGWGMTNVGADVIDFYYYVWNEDETKYWYVDHWEDVEQVEENIKIKTDDGFETRTLIVNITRHGPVIQRDNAKFAIRWTGHGVTLEVKALYLYNKATNLSEFLEGMRFFHVPGQNIVYADIYGHIAYYPGARYPIRENNVTGMLPFNGSAGEGEWVGFVPFEKIPHVIDPPWHYIVTANNRPAGKSFPYYWGDSEYFSPRYRALRITMLINSTDKLSIEDMMRIQGDDYSIPASIFVPYIQQVFEAKTDKDPYVEEALQYLSNWNYSMKKDLVAPTIYLKWLEIYRNKTFGDEYAKAGIYGKAKLPDIPVLEYFTETNYQKYFDNKYTAKVESRDDIIKESFIEAIQSLKEELGDDMSKWTYGSVHVREFNHPLGVVLSWLNYGSFPDHGSRFTVDPAGGYTSTSGASWREIINFANLSDSYCVIPGGQSGNRFSHHYDDQLPLWLETKYKLMTFPSSPEEQEDVESILVLKPGEE